MEDEKEARVEYYFGCGPCRPKWLNVFANKKFFLLIACFIPLLHGMLAGLLPVSISTLEKRYNFSSSESGALFAVDGIGAIAIIFVCYFGAKSHKPRFIGAFVIILATGALTIASPQFLFGSYSVVTSTNFSTNVEECLDEVNYNSDENCLSVNIGAYTLIFIGQAVNAVGGSPLYTVVLAYIDEIVFPRYVSIYIAVYLISSVLGPVLGFGLGSAFLSIYVEPWRYTSLTEEDPAWVGAWWIGLVLVGISLLFLSIPFFMFPRYLPDSHLVRQERAKEMAKIYSSKYANEDNLTIIVKMFPIHIKRLLLNPSFMFLSFGLAIAFILKDGLVGFGPKYVETVFGVTPTESGLLAGGVGVAGAIIGTVTGGLIIYCFKLRGRQAGALLWIVILLCIPASFLYFVRCPSYQVAGVIAPYADGSMSGPDSSLCAQQCNCTSTIYQPVCGADSLTYFSPCRAGCAITPRPEGGFLFENCTCVMESLAAMINSTQNTSTINGTLPIAIDGRCDTDCGFLLWIFTIAIGILIILLLLLEAPYFYSTLRVVADDQRHLALGVQAFIYKIFGSIPSYLLFGVIFDSSCVLWNYECGKRGNCWIYDNITLSINSFSLALPAVSLVAICFFMHWLLYPKRKDGDVKEEKIEANNPAMLEREKIEANDNNNVIELEL